MLVARSVNHIIKNGEALAAGEAGLGEEAAGGFRVVAEAFGSFIMGRAVGDEMAGDGLAAAEDFLGEALFINGEGEGLADARIFERRLGGVDAQEVGAEVWERVEIGAFIEDIQQFVGEVIAVPDDVGLAGFVEVEGRAGNAHGEEIDGGALGVGIVPVKGILAEADFVVEAPGFEEVRAAGGKVFGAQPAIGILVDHLAGDDGEGLEGAKAEEEGGGMI